MPTPTPLRDYRSYKGLPQLAGLCTVVAAGTQFEKLAENQLDEETLASPAIADGRIYLRARKHLYAIGAK